MEIADLNRDEQINLSWHDANNDPPKLPGDYMTFTGQEIFGYKIGFYSIMHWNKGWNVGKSGDNSHEITSVTHWMPLPLAPNGYNEVH